MCLAEVLGGCEGIQPQDRAAAAEVHGGLDIYAAKKDGLGSFLYIVECKPYTPPNKVGVEIVRSLYGVAQATRATAGAIVTTSFFSWGAEEFRRDVQYQLQFHDYIALQRWFEAFPART